MGNKEKSNRVLVKQFFSALQEFLGEDFILLREVLFELPLKNRKSFAWTEGRIDCWAIGLCEEYESFIDDPNHHSGFGMTYSIEIKVDKSDYNKEIARPWKREPAYAFCNRFYFYAPKGLISPRELPPRTGLLEYSNGEVAKVVEASWHKARIPSWEQISYLFSKVKQLPYK